MSLRLRLILSMVALLGGAALAMAAATYRSVLAETEALFDYQLRQMALSLRDQGEIAPGPAQALADEDLDFVIQIWTVDGRTIYASRQHTALPAQALLGLATVTAGNEAWRTFSVTTGLRVIQVAQPVRIRRALAADAALRSVAPLLWLMPLLALGVWWLTSRALRPLRRVAGEVQARGAAALAPLPATGLPEEIAPLVASLNDLLGRLSRSMDTQRAFVADAAHELRSPLTALKLQLSLLERARDDAGRAEAVAQLRSGIDRAVRLVEQLLALARNEPGGGASTLAPVDLSEVARDALAAAAPAALSHGVELELVADAPVTVQGDAAALGMLVRNLADNAVRHGHGGRQVRVSVALDGARPTLTVDDAGPGIPAAERERVFDRFYRRHADDAEGSGLGLAIVRSIAQRHGATVSLDDAPLGGLRVRVAWPRQEPAPRPGR